MSLEQQILEFERAVSVWAVALPSNSLAMQELSNFVAGTDSKKSKNADSFPFSIVRFTESVFHLVSHTEVGEPGAAGRVKLSFAMRLSGNQLQIDLNPTALKIIRTTEKDIPSTNSLELTKLLYPIEFCTTERPTLSTKSRYYGTLTKTYTDISIEIGKFVTAIEQLYECAQTKQNSNYETLELTWRNLATGMEQLLQEYHVTINSIQKELQTPSKKYLVMPLFAGEDLFTFIERHYTKRTKITEEQLQWIICSLVEQLHAIHTKGIAHRDIKPENIIINPESYEAFIIDYDFAERVPATATEIKFKGTPAYAYSNPYYMREGIGFEILNFERDVYGLFKVFEWLFRICDFKTAGKGSLKHFSEIIINFLKFKTEEIIGTPEFKTTGTIKYLQTNQLYKLPTPRSQLLKAPITIHLPPAAAAASASPVRSKRPAEPGPPSSPLKMVNRALQSAPVPTP